MPRCTDCGRENSPTWVCPSCQKKRDEKPVGMTDKHADIRESLAKITEGQWLVDGTNGVIWNDNGRIVLHMLNDYENPDDHEFIANAPEYVRRLLDEVERQNDFINAEIAHWEGVTENAVKEIERLRTDLESLAQENERLRKALEEIASITGNQTLRLSGAPSIARKALEGTE